MSNLLQSASILLTPTAYNEGFIHSIKPLRTFGGELVVNGDFEDGDSNWDINPGWSISDGKANIDTDNGTENFFQIGGNLVVGRKYKLSLNANLSVGSIKFESGEGDNLIFTSDIDSHIFIADGPSPTFRRQVVPTRGYIDNISVVEVTDGDFDFTRATIATRVNSSGLIESVVSGLPRINFLGSSSDAHWLLEPQSTNTATYSNDFTQGDIFNASGNPTLSNTVLTANQGTAPDGTNTAFLLKDNNNGGTGQTGLSYFNTFVDANDFNTFSVFVKKSLSNNFIYLSSGGYDTAANGQSYFNIQDGTLSTTSSNHTASIEDYGNGWYRCSITNKVITDLQGSFNVFIATSDNTSTITRDGTNGVLLFGLQAEADTLTNFATSYIPTNGSTVTRNKDQANSSGDTSLISSTQGVLYAEIAAFRTTGVFESISISDGTVDNTIRIFINNSENSPRIQIKTGGVSQGVISGTVTDVTAFNKLAIRYKNNDCDYFINGVLVGTDTSVTIPSGLDSLNFSAGNAAGSPYEGKAKCVAVFKEFLDNDELEALTGEGFSSFAALAAAGGFTII